MMSYDPNRHHRRSIRLRGYDYTRAGMYFVTICAKDRECLLGEVAGGEMRVNRQGEIVAAYWQAMPRHFSNLELDAFVIMPNHMHGIIMIVGAKHLPQFPNASPLRSSQPPHGTQPASLAAIVQNFKSVSARKINLARGTPGAPVWQRNYYEHIVRNQADLQRIREYVANNPLKWDLDQLHPDRA